MQMQRKTIYYHLRKILCIRKRFLRHGCLIYVSHMQTPQFSQAPFYSISNTQTSFHAICLSPRHPFTPFPYLPIDILSLHFHISQTFHSISNSQTSFHTICLSPRHPFTPFPYLPIDILSLHSHISLQTSFHSISISPRPFTPYPIPRHPFTLFVCLLDILSLHFQVLDILSRYLFVSQTSFHSISNSQTSFHAICMSPSYPFTPFPYLVDILSLHFHISYRYPFTPFPCLLDILSLHFHISQISFHSISTSPRYPFTPCPSSSKVVAQIAFPLPEIQNTQSPKN